MGTPHDPVAAATHPDPYSYYAELVTRKPFYRDDALGLWVATSAEAVESVLRHPLGRVRPPGEPIPDHLLGTAAATIFGRLIRMNDGAVHCPLKRAVVTTLDTLAPAQVGTRSALWARALVAELGVATAPERLDTFALRLPVYVVASLLGVADEDLPAMAAAIGAFVSCLAPGNDVAQRAQGAVAADALLATFRALLAAGQADDLMGRLAAFARADREAGYGGAESLIANGIGLLMQTYEATAGLIGNTLVALAARPAGRKEALSAPAALPAIVREVLRHDPPIQNTRRYLADDARILGRSVRGGDTILVVLAAANRDPAANADPARFDPRRSAPRLFTFGAGRHACPGAELAFAIAAAGVAQLLAAGLAPEGLRHTMGYRPSPNARIPIFGTRIGS